jgi:4-hydroxybenzoate polyprenyltransferase
LGARENEKSIMWIRLKYYSQLIRFDKPIGTLLLMWPMLMALWVAGTGHPSLKNIFIFMAGCFLMRSAGCAINDFADRKVDGLVERTKGRPLAQGLISPLEAVMVFIICAFFSLLLVLQTNTLTLKWSVLALSLAFIYPFMKRVSYYPQCVLGAAFASAIPMAFAAQMNKVPAFVGLLYAATLFWVLAYDTQYAMVDRIDDLKANIKSTAIAWGNRDRTGILIAYLGMIILLALFGFYANLSWPFYASLGVVLGAVFYQHHLIQSRQPADCFKAFLNNNAIGFILFLGVFFSCS